MRKVRYTNILGVLNKMVEGIFAEIAKILIPKLYIVFTKFGLLWNIFIGFFKIAKSRESNYINIAYINLG